MAAGKGTRMKSTRPKVLHRLGGRPLLGHVMGTAQALGADLCVVVTGHEAGQVKAFVQAEAEASGWVASAVLQEPQLGTGHAVQQAVPLLPDAGVTLILSGDVPLTQVATLQGLVQACQGAQVALLTLSLDNPTGYGRVKREGWTPSASPNAKADALDKVSEIVEHKDASPAERQINEIYSGVMALPTLLLKKWLARLDNRNAQSEYYLTDIVKFAVADAVPVVAYKIEDEAQVAGINSPAQLAALERVFQTRNAEALLAQGVSLADPQRFDLRGELVCGPDVEIDVNCVFEGQVHLGQGVRIGANCVIANAHIGAGTVVHPFTHIDGAQQGVRVGEGASIGPFARLRPGALLGNEVHIGNFVEVKNATLADGAKANHLAYLGDATVGERVNYGAGSITANYDGANKHRTVIQADVHIGSNCVLVAPVTIGAGATIGGGSTITKDVPAGSLAVARGKQVSIADWARPAKLAKR
jgi:bifunctional UDP-N-acetylglucosamine pyrophosphorylase / glucosamine-1-phosphate N-acetyltransferase